MGSSSGSRTLALRTTYVEAFGVTDDAARSVLDSRAARHSRHFGGYASSLYVFARAAAREGRRDVTFESVISWGDKMFPEYRELIEATFSTRVFDTYGSTEGLVIAGQRDLDQYYVLSPHVVVELLDAHDRPVPVGELGRVVVTRLDARAMPLVRYSLGDLAVWGERPDDAELGFPVLERIVGRDTDIVETPSGRHLIVHTFTGIFEFFDEIEQFRIVQRVATGIDVEYIPRPGFGPSHRRADRTTAAGGDRRAVRHQVRRGGPDSQHALGEAPDRLEPVARASLRDAVVAARPNGVGSASPRDRPTHATAPQGWGARPSADTLRSSQCKGAWMRVVVTGGAGFVGANLCRCWQEQRVSTT